MNARTIEETLEKVTASQEHPQKALMLYLITEKEKERFSDKDERPGRWIACWGEHSFSSACGMEMRGRGHLSVGTTPEEAIRGLFENEAANAVAAARHYRSLMDAATERAARVADAVGESEAR
jgi:hypothetical protein